MNNPAMPQEALEIAIGNAEQCSRCPSHGWAVNPQGTKLLWFPIKRLIENTYAVRRARGVDDRIVMNKPASSENEQVFYVFPVDPKNNDYTDRSVTLVPGTLSPVPFYASLNEIAILLKEIHRFERTQQAIPDSPDSREQREFLVNMNQLGPMYTKWLYIEFRRLMDLLAIHVGRLAFEKTSSLPNTFPQLKDLVGDSKRAISQKPLLDIDKLALTLSETSSWFHIIRDPTGGNKGLRDALSHSNLRILFGRQRADDQSWHLTARLSSSTSGLELIATIPVITYGMCRLFTDLCLLVNRKNEYSRSDCLPLLGDDRDLAGFWPEI